VTGRPISLLRSLVLAWHFLTIVPLSRVGHDPSPRELARSMRWYPAVGLGIGLILAISDWLLTGAFARGVEELLLFVVLTGVTGGLHLDGLADALDGLAGGKTPAERLAIMRDPRIGAIGAAGLIMDLALRVAGLMALPPAARFPVLLCMPAIGRWAMVIAAWNAPSARADGGLAVPFLRELTWKDALVATTVAFAAVLWGLGPFATLVTMGLGALAARVVTRTASRLCGGITGDLLGATNELAEILFLLAVPVVVGSA
jgi:adenosylcobinamide-GDP ribazoletransferase